MSAGRPTALTPEVAKTIVTAVRKGLPHGVCAALAKVHRNSLYNWMERGEKDEAEEPYASFAIEVRHAEALWQEEIWDKIANARPGIPGVSGADLVSNLQWMMSVRFPRSYHGNVRANTEASVEEIMKRIVEVLEPASLEKVRAALSTDPGSRSAAEPRH